jgi:hypothetical protein
MSSSSIEEHASTGAVSDQPAVPEPSFAERARTLVLCLAKTLSAPEIKSLSSSHKVLQCQIGCHVQPHAAELGNVETLLSFPWKTTSRESRASSAVGRAKA